MKNVNQNFVIRQMLLYTHVRKTYNIIIIYFLFILFNMEEDIKEIELLNDVKLLNVIINDLSTCVKDQGLKLDQIENNLTRTDDIIDRSITELDKAKNYKDKINKKYLTLAGIGGLLIYLLIL